MRWQPLFPRRLEAQFERELRPYVESLLAHSANKEYDLSLEHGITAFVVFFSVLDQYRSHPEWKKIVAQALRLSRKRLRGGHPGLLGGNAGIYWAHEQFGRVRDLAEWKRNQVPKKSAILRQSEVDLPDGLVGIGVGYLGMAGSGPLQLAILERLADLHARKKGKSFGWLYRGSVDLGLAHGIAGVVLYMSYLHQSRPGLLKSAHRKMLSETIEFLLRWDREHGYFSYVESDPDHRARAGWCYGDPAIGFALFRAGESFRSSGWKKEGVRIAKRGLRSSPRKAKIANSHFCHGSIGLAHLSARLFQGTRDQEFKTLAERWYAVAMKRAPAFDPNEESHDLISGPMSHYLYAMAGLIKTDPVWDRHVLMSGLQR